MKKRVMKINCNTPVGAFAGVKDRMEEPVFANADGDTPDEQAEKQEENDSTPWWQVVGSIGDTVSGVLGALFPFFDKRNNSTTIVKYDSKDLFKYLIFGVLAIVAVLLVLRFTKK